MRVLYVHHCGVKGGAGNSLLYLLQWLGKRGYDIHVITQRGSIASHFKKITENVLEVPGIFMFFTLANTGTLRTLFNIIKTIRYIRYEGIILRYIEKTKPAIVHLNEIGMFSLARKIKKKYNLPVVMHARTVPNKRHPLLIKFFNRQIESYVDNLICISKSVHLHYNTRNAVVIHNPVHISEHDVTEKQPPKSDKDPAPLNVLFLANLLQFKGIEETIDAMIRLKHKPDIQFTVIGSNVRPDAFFRSFLGRALDFLGIYKNYEKRLINAIDSNRLNTRFLGQVEHIDVEIEQADVIIAPMHLNGTPRSVIEAGAHGVPSVLSLSDKVEDLVVNNQTGWLINEKSSEELIKAILYASENRDLLKEMGRQSGIRIRKLCGQSVVADKVEKVYSKLLS